MHFRTIIGQVASLLIFQQPLLASACGDHGTTTTTTTTSKRADSGTVSIYLQHFALNVASIEESLKFYVDVLGMVELYSFNPAPFLKTTNLGHANGLSNFNLELVEVVANSTNPAPTAAVPSTVKSSTFSHFGIVVSDMTATRKKFISAGVRILKDVGKELDPYSPFLTAFGLDRLPRRADNYIAWRRQIVTSLAGIGFNNFMVIADPDGNAIEVVASS